MAKVTMNKYGWEYIYDQGAQIPYDIIPEEHTRKELPPTLFKYYALNSNSLSAILEGYVYAPHPQQLNDPFDCYEQLISFDDVEGIKTFIGDAIPDDELEAQLADPSPDFKHMVEYHFSLIIYQKLGILSLTEDSNNMLMWAYYSYHQGFAVEYDYTQFSFKYHGPFQMNYQEALEPVSITKGGALAVLYHSNVKTINWAHESEWRILPEVIRSPKHVHARDSRASRIWKH